MLRTCSRPSYQTLITYSCLLTCFDVGSGSSFDHASGGVGGVMVSLTTMVKEWCGSSFLINLHGSKWCQTADYNTSQGVGNIQWQLGINKSAGFKSFRHCCRTSERNMTASIHGIHFEERFQFKKSKIKEQIKMLLAEKYFEISNFIVRQKFYKNIIELKEMAIP